MTWGWSCDEARATRDTVIIWAAIVLAVAVVSIPVYRDANYSFTSC
jgi:hypothetical protein